MIPKIIHYCWLSNDPYPELIEKCIKSWKKILPEYEFILWDTSRIDINKNLWLKQTYENKKYAFAADYIRCYALYTIGGIYLDADVEVIKSFNPLLQEGYILGEEASGDIEAAVIGAEKGTLWLKDCLDYYENRAFIKNDGTFDTTPIPLLFNKVLNNSKQKFKINTYDYFSPKNYHLGTINITNNTYCIHHFDGKWLDRGRNYKIKIKIHKALYRLLGRNGHNSIIKLSRKIIKLIKYAHARI